MQGQLLAERLGGHPVHLVDPAALGVLVGAVPRGALLAHLPLADRATLGNMSPEFGSTCAIFPIDGETLRYLELSGRDPKQIALVEAYARAQGMWREDGQPDALYTDVLELDLGDGRLAVSALALTDPNALDQDLFRAARLEADGMSCADRFYVCAEDYAMMDGSRVVFGYVVEGLENARLICDAPMSSTRSRSAAGSRVVTTIPAVGTDSR